MFIGGLSWQTAPGKCFVFYFSPFANIDQTHEPFKNNFFCHVKEQFTFCLPVLTENNPTKNMILFYGEKGLGRLFSNCLLSNQCQFLYFNLFSVLIFFYISFSTFFLSFLSCLMLSVKV